MIPSVRPAAALLALALALATGCSASETQVAPGADGLRHVAVPGHGELLLQVPAGWRVVARQPRTDVPTEVRLSPPSGAGLAVSLKADWGVDGPQRLDVARSRLDERTALLARRAQAGAAPLKPLEGTEVRGWYATVADPTRSEGFPVITTGVAQVGGLIVTFDVYTDGAEVPAVAEGVELVRTARHAR